MITVRFEKGLGWCAARGPKTAREYLHNDGVWRASAHGEDGGSSGYFLRSSTVVYLASVYGDEICVLKNRF